MFWQSKRKLGIHIPKNKDQTKNKPSRPVTPPAQVTIPLGMHIGKPSTLKVAVGDHVCKGTLIGESADGISANVHASISGKVIAIEEKDSFRGEQTAVIIENDFTDEEVLLDHRSLPKTPEEFTKILHQAGITGKGGAGFPASIKYKLDKKAAEYLVVNGAECEPYSTTDHRVMLEYAEELIDVICLISDIYDLKESYLAMEGHMEEPMERLNQAILKKGRSNIRIKVLSDTYPQGHAGLQIRSVLGIEIENDQRSGDVGVLQSNVSTIKAIYDAVFLQKSYTSRIITVSGEKINNPDNLMVPCGTLVQHLIEDCGGIKDGDCTLINGGPMMGKRFENTEIPVDKDTTTILVTEKVVEKERSECIRCAKCVDHCPVNLEPISISNAYENRYYTMAPDLNSDVCIACGLCTYICPANIPLLANIQSMNEKWEELNEGKK